jgi:hypothetical protein
MIDVLIPVFFVAVLIIFLSGTFYLAKMASKRIENNFKELGQRLGLNFIVPEKNFWKNLANLNHPKLDGNISGIPIKVHIETRGSGKSKVQYIVFDVDLNTNHQNSIKIFHEGFFRKIGKKLGLQKDVNINDEDFDRLFIIKSDSPGFARAIFSDNILKEKMIDNYRLMNNAQIGFHHNSIHFEAINSFYYKKEVDKLEELIRMSLLLAQKLMQIDNKHFDDGSFS